MPMSPRLLRPRQTIHPEAADWASRVRTNGGSVSGTTLSAVDRFVKAIVAAGIRDRFYRLNLFAGNSDANLAAVRTPLFRGPSRTGTQFGNATDTNVNCVQGDYSATDGLTSAASPPKYLTTGLSPDTIGPATGHLSVVVKGAASSAAALGIGSRSSGAAQRYDLQTSNRNGFFLDGVLDFYSTGTWGASSTVIYQRTGDSTRPAGQYLVTRTSSSRADWYLNGVSVANSTASVTPGANPNEFYVCGINNNGTPFYHGVTTIRGYSLGLSMTGPQAAAFSSAFASLNAALGRA